MLARLAATGTVAAGPALAADADPHVAWEARLQSLTRPEQADGLDEAAFDALADEIFELHDQIGETLAHGLSGAAVQIKLAIDAEESGRGIGECELAAPRNALATIELLRGQGLA
jgi:hypothetical protein